MEQRFPSITFYFKTSRPPVEFPLSSLLPQNSAFSISVVFIFNCLTHEKIILKAMLQGNVANLVVCMLVLHTTTWEGLKVLVASVLCVQKTTISKGLLVLVQKFVKLLPQTFATCKHKTCSYNSDIEYKNRGNQMISPWVKDLYKLFRVGKSFLQASQVQLNL